MTDGALAYVARPALSGRRARCCSGRS
jgi:hypothetical protein